MKVNIRYLNEQDPAVIVEAFALQGWSKPPELYVNYIEEERKGSRVTLVAEVDGDFAGYTNVLWDSYYPPFRERGIPEINDFNVLIKYRRQGIGSLLMDHAEEVIRQRSEVAGIGVGIFSDYGNAQILYARRGYVPDGRGIHNGQRHIGYGETVMIDDDIVLYLTKNVK
ncbi:GNAT family N-acetyltransferase [Paenibacillaceae bacterium]|nr:GNAT family N-acetyltransferase [Paenibacillaceae bacterium]